MESDRQAQFVHCNIAMGSRFLAGGTCRFSGISGASNKHMIFKDNNCHELFFHSGQLIGARLKACSDSYKRTIDDLIQARIPIAGATGTNQRNPVRVDSVLPAASLPGSFRTLKDATTITPNETNFT